MTQPHYNDIIVPRTPSGSRKRRLWSNDETDSLLLGCMKHGVGNWKIMVQDPTLKFEQRTAVDLKDRFRVICPKPEYQHLYGQQELSTYYLAYDTDHPIPVTRIKRRSRRVFSDEEDRALLAGVEKYGVSWSSIAKDPVLNLAHRKSGDLRDRFRNRYPDRYEQLGFAPRLNTPKRQDNISNEVKPPMDDSPCTTKKQKKHHDDESRVANQCRTNTA